MGWLKWDGCYWNCINYSILYLLWNSINYSMDVWIGLQCVLYFCIYIGVGVDIRFDCVDQVVFWILVFIYFFIIGYWTLQLDCLLVLYFSMYYICYIIVYYLIVSRVLIGFYYDCNVLFIGYCSVLVLSIIVLIVFIIICFQFYVFIYYCLFIIICIKFVIFCKSTENS